MIGSVAFLAPWLLVGLATLPILWWLLRAVPPAPGPPGLSRACGCCSG